MGATEEPEAVCDGGDLDCGSGLLLIIREAMAPLRAGGVLEVRSREGSVREDLPAWCRMVGHDFLGAEPGEGRETRYRVRKQGADDRLAADLAKARDHRWRVRVRAGDGVAATAFARNHSFAVGQPASFDTGDAAPSAVEVLLGSLGACLAVGFRWRATRRGIEVRDLEVALEARCEDVLVFLGLADEGNPGLAEVAAVAYVDASASEEDLRPIWEDAVRRSPVAQTLLRGARAELTMKGVG
jgi:TusA-related sulfurtransferase/uncharacterized OsmC-like protein